MEINMNKKEMIIQNISDSIDTKKKILQDEEFIEKSKRWRMCVLTHIFRAISFLCAATEEVHPMRSTWQVSLSAGI
ncbi:hypothetical protein BACPEC_02361 [[Bacteroides] pectinophilus ATCC 43243]|uniref:Uncharacterized protein n=1 Tax=[Bacteroides] pectinophilus ATCC 43243 TaxID=483218 RepID=B7AUG3_9FIRM|nr:hypothetical protein BACPEC_02361 [[Bacteroides] pectinophilus ATCC 43243]